jgi:hypothetical protein
MHIHLRLGAFLIILYGIGGLGCSASREEENVTSGPVNPILSLSSIQNSQGIPLDNPNTPIDLAETVTLSFIMKGQNGLPLINQPVSFQTQREDDLVKPAFAITDDMGKVSCMLSAAKKGIANVTATSGTYSMQAMVVFAARPPSAQQSFWETVGAPVIADNQDLQYLRFTVRDVEKNKLAGVTVQFTSSSILDTLTPLRTVSDADGVCRVSLRGLGQGPRTISALLASGSVPTSVTMAPGPASANQSLCQGDTNAILADGRSQAVIKLVLKDAAGIALANRAVRYSPTGSAYIWEPAVATTANDGSITLKVASSKVGKVPILLAAGNVQFRQDIIFKAGPLDPSASSFSISPASQVANDIATINLKVLLKDSYGHGLPNEQIAFTFSGNPATVQAPIGQSNSQGQYLTTMRSPLAGKRPLVAQSGAAYLTQIAQFTAVSPTCPGGPTYAALDPALFIDTDNISNMVITDLNFDGYMDVITTSAFGSSYRVQMGQGQGRFVANPEINIGQQIHSLAVADIDKDGVSDFIVTLPETNEVGLLLLDRDYNYTNLLKLSVGQNPGALIVADFDQDGLWDVACVNRDDATISVLFGTPQTYFNPAQTFAVGSSPQSLIALQADTDDLLDIAVANFGDSTISILANISGQNFATQSVLTVNGQPKAIQAANLGADRKKSLLTVNAGTNTLGVRFKTNEGFSPEVSYPVGSNPISLAISDINYDGSNDVVTSSIDDASLSVLYANDDDLFNNATTVSVPNIRLGAQMVALFNYNDERVTLATTDNVIQSYRIDANGVIYLYDPATIALGPSPTPFIRVSDFNQDGVMDIVALSAEGSYVQILLGAGSSQYAAPLSYDLQGIRSIGVEVGDLDGDGYQDIVISGYTSAVVSVLYGRGDGTFTNPVSMSLGQIVFVAKLADLNHDGLLDIVVTGATDPNVGILYNAGRRSFTPAQHLSTGGRTSLGLAVVDLDLNGQMDLITTDIIGSSICVLMCNGDDTFQSPKISPTIPRPADILLGDYNEDGHLDLVINPSSRGVMEMMLGDGAGYFQALPLVNADEGFQSAVVGDYTGDGHLDIFKINADLRSFGLMVGQGDGRFAPTIVYDMVRPMSGEIITSDMNNDGRLDVIVGDLKQLGVKVFLNKGCQ